MDRMSNINYSLICAVRQGRVEEVRELITSHSLSYSEAWAEGYVLLCDSIKNKHTEITKLLLMNGSRVNRKSKKPSDTALHLAVKNGDIEIINMLLCRDAKIDAINQCGSTPLHEAIKCNNIEVIELLIKHNANVIAKDKRGLIPLHVAIKYSHAKVVKLLLDLGAKVNDKNKHGKNALHIAAQRGNLEIMEYILKYRPDVNEKINKSCLHDAVYNCRDNDRSKVVERLLQYGFSVSREDINDCRLLHNAVANGYLKIVESLLKYGANVNMPDRFISSTGFTPLHNASAYKQKEMAVLLINYGADINAIDEAGKTPIFYAVDSESSKITKHYSLKRVDMKDTPELVNTGLIKKYKEIIEALLQNGANINAKDFVGKSPIFYAVQSAHLQIIKILLSNGAVISDMPDLLNTAVQKKSKEIIEFLLQYGADINAKDCLGKPPIFYAVQNNDLRIIKLLYSNGADIKSMPELLNTAVHKKCKETIKFLLQHGADINAKDGTGKSPIFYAVVDTDLEITQPILTNEVIKVMPGPLNTTVDEKYSKIIELLLQHGADINAKDDAGKTPIFYAIQNDDLQIFKLLLDRGADIIGKPELLNIAVKKKCREIIKVLLRHGVDINASDENGLTALHCSTLRGFCTSSKVEIAKLLLRCGANVNAKQTNGITALHIAIRNYQKDTIEALLICGAKVDSASEKGTTPLHIAAFGGSSEIIRSLLKFGANIDVKDEYGRTALHIACIERQSDIVMSLLEHGADINIVSKDNYTPLECAMDGDSFCKRVDICYPDDDGGEEYLYADCNPISYIIVNYFKEHIFKMITANLYVSEKNLSLLGGDNNSRFQSLYEEEIEMMKGERISDSNISFYNFLTKNISQLVIYARNENIVQVLKLGDYKTKFPHYASMITSCFEKVMKRKELLEQGNKCSLPFFNMFPELPYSCIEKIFSYLSNEDLKILLDVCK